jgi:hypothetical protein
MKMQNVFLFALVLGALISCAEQRPPINRVQPLALKKSYFVGDDFKNPHDDPEFYTQGTLIDVGYGAAQDGLFTSTYAQPVARIKWEVTENLLIGRLAHERIQGTDEDGLNLPSKQRQDGVIVVAYPIETHFDVANEYNSVTGEKINIVSENNFDRPWYEREYFRINWSKNLNTDSYDFDTLSQLGVFGGIIYEPLSYDITDPADPNYPFLDLENGYFDVTNKAFARPQDIDLSHLGWGIKSFPACFLDADILSGSGPSGSCNPVELTIRQSFRRIEKAKNGTELTDYEPADWEGYRFQSFGAFTEDRLGFARNYGLVDAKKRYFIDRYNIWQKSHYYSDPVNLEGHIACNTPETTGDLDITSDAEIEQNDYCNAEVQKATGVAGSYCDVFTQKCTLPFSRREVKPVRWFYTKDSDLRYFDGTATATHQWDVAFRMAVSSARYTECVNNGGTAGPDGSCASEYPIHFGQQDVNEELLSLVAEANVCKAKERANAGDPSTLISNSTCTAQIDQIATARGYQYKDALVKLAMQEPIIVLCHSPVQADDHPFCNNKDMGEKRLPANVSTETCQNLDQSKLLASADAAERAQAESIKKACNEALNVRIGDLRYHQVNVIKDPQTPSPWGIMVDAQDPLTGESIAASINVWAYINDVWSQKVVDTLRYIKGELSAEDVTEGKFITEWALAAERANGGVAPRMTAEERDHRIAALANGEGFENMAQFQEAKAKIKGVLPEEIQQKAISIKQQIQNVKASLEAPSSNLATYLTRAAQAKNTQVEASLMTPMVQQMMGIEGLPLSDSVLEMSSLLRGGNPTFRRELEHFKELALANRGACILYESEVPVSMVGLADLLQKKFGAFNKDDDHEVQLLRAEKMRNYLAHRAHTAVIVHEMGHSVGERHNFVSSSDAYNYRPQYWQLRTKNGTVTEQCTDLSSDGENCVGPRYFDPITKSEKDNLLWMWMHSSVMDYAGENTQDLLGLGAYDFAAARAFYGNSYAVFSDPSYAMGTDRSRGMIGKMDNFGGILGFQWDIQKPNNEQIKLHYSQLNNFYDLIQQCENIADPYVFKPTNWDDATNGPWEPTLDGLLVTLDGVTYSRCKQQPVDYVTWQDLSMPDQQIAGEFYRGGVAVDDQNRVRVPYGFGTDSWADLGNLSVYRHDNGADAYELFDFFISQQEVNHIFDNYRRGKNDFSVRNAAGRALGRYNSKMRDGAKGLGLLKSIYKTFATNLGYSFADFWYVLADDFFDINMLASGVAFDFFTRQLSRPELGPHYLDANFILRSQRDAIGQEDNPVALNMPNGVTGIYGNVVSFGRPIENELAQDKGEYNSQYTISAGSYYEKMYTSMLLTESYDNFISSDRSEFVDGRFRSISMADIFPDGYRRWLANNLTWDDEIRGQRFQSDRDGKLSLDAQGFPTTPLGWTTWWGPEPRTCFPNKDSILCDVYGDENNPRYGASRNAYTVVVDPQIGWEQQQFLINWTMVYLPENQQQFWIDQMRIWEYGVDADPQIEAKIEFHNPEGKTYVAKTFGKEKIFGKTVQKGIAARVLEYANSLLAQAYETTDGPDLDGDGNPDWYEPVFNEGQAVVKYDPTLKTVLPNGSEAQGKEGCDEVSNVKCVCEDNRACIKLREYVQVPFYLRETMNTYHFGGPRTRGIF